MQQDLVYYLYYLHTAVKVEGIENVRVLVVMLTTAMMVVYNSSCPRHNGEWSSVSSSVVVVMIGWSWWSWLSWWL